MGTCSSSDSFNANEEERVTNHVAYSNNEQIQTLRKKNNNKRNTQNAVTIAQS